MSNAWFPCLKVAAKEPDDIVVAVSDLVIFAAALGFPAG